MNGFRTKPERYSRLNSIEVIIEHVGYATATVGAGTGRPVEQVSLHLADGSVRRGEFPEGWREWTDALLEKALPTMNHWEVQPPT
jgi:hypothetical protein